MFPPSIHLLALQLQSESWGNILNKFTGSGYCLFKIENHLRYNWGWGKEVVAAKLGIDPQTIFCGR